MDHCRPVRALVQAELLQTLGVDLLCTLSFVRVSRPVQLALYL